MNKQVGRVAFAIAVLTLGTVINGVSAATPAAQSISLIDISQTTESFATGVPQVAVSRVDPNLVAVAWRRGRRSDSLRGMATTADTRLLGNYVGGRWVARFPLTSKDPHGSTAENAQINPEVIPSRSAIWRASSSLEWPVALV